MKEKLYTIPVNEGFEAEDECPFCAMERKEEQRAIRYFAGPGASYMEPDVRGATDRAGFCPGHYKKLYDYGNALGNALMMQTYYAGLLEEWEQEIQTFAPPAKRSIFRKRKSGSENALLVWVKRRQDSCFLCQRMEYNMDRYFATFFVLIQNPEFRELVESGNGFCMRHFAQLLERAEKLLPNSQHNWFYETLIPVMGKNLIRVKEDIDWFVGMFDYRNAGRDWKNSRDAVSRGMQKLGGLYPADKPYRSDP